LIKQLQRGHLPLAEIRSRLAALSDNDVRAALAQEPESPGGTAIDYIRAVLGSKGVVPMTGGLAAQSAPHRTYAVPPPLSSRKGRAAPAAPSPPGAADVPGAGQRLLKTRSLELQSLAPSSNVMPPSFAAPPSPPGGVFDEESQAHTSLHVVSARAPDLLDARSDRSTWERIALAPDIELHVRRPLSRVQNRFLDRLLDLVRKLLKEEQP
jgi:hypothetical protein